MAGAHTLYNTYWVRFAHGAVEPRRGGRQQPGPVRRGGQRRRAAHRARLDHEPEPELARLLLPRQGRRSSRRWRTAACRTRSPGPPSCSAATASWSTTSPGCCGGCRSSPSAAAAVTGCGPFTSTTWPGCARTSAPRTGDVIVDAVGPQSLTFRQLVEEIRDAVGSRVAASCRCPARSIPRAGGRCSTWCCGTRC